MRKPDSDFASVLELLGDEAAPIPMYALYALSDVHGDDLERLCATLDEMSSDRRRRLLRSMFELSEASFEVSFDAVFWRCLDSADEVVRAIAIDGLWENQNPALIGPLLSLLRTDPSAQVRAAAAASLGRFVLAGELEELEAAVEARILEDLIRVLQMPRETVDVRRRAIESIAYACLPETTELLEQAYHDQDERMRQSAVVGMGRSCDRRWEPILLEELASDSPAMRYEACLACGELMLRRAVPALGRLLHDRDREVSQAAIWALGQIGSVRARRLLLQAYDMADEDMQAALEDALAEQAFAAGELEAAFLGFESEDESQLVDEDLAGWPEAEEGEEDEDYEPKHPMSRDERPSRGGDSGWAA